MAKRHDPRSNRVAHRQCNVLRRSESKTLDSCCASTRDLVDTVNAWHIAIIVSRYSIFRSADCDITVYESTFFTLMETDCDRARIISRSHVSLYGDQSNR